MFRPKLLDALKGYDRQRFMRDALAGLIVGLVALPLSIAFAIASGVSPEKGLITAIVAGFIISALGGSRVQIGGPTGAFIVIVYGIVQAHGVDGLIIATFMAGVILILMGFARLGSLIKFIPHPLIIGFTSGIALIILSSQVKDLLGLKMGPVPGDFLAKWQSYAGHARTASPEAIGIGVATIAVIAIWPKIKWSEKVPGSLVAILATTVVARLFHLPVETIGSRFGNISTTFPRPIIPHLDLGVIRNLIRPAFTIALLGGIESLLSAVVADGMIGGNHRSNTELIAQGVANVCSAVFGGIPATGAIARTATNVKNGGRTPVAGMVHALTLLLILLFFGRWAALIPMATLAGVLVVVAYNMSEWRNFISVLKGPRSDMAVLATTFLLTVWVDLTVAIEIGMILAAFLFMRTMIKISEVKILTKALEEDRSGEGEMLNDDNLPRGVQVFELKGPLFFGAAYKFRDAIRLMDKHPRVLIIRMGNVPMIDATGIRTIREVLRTSRQRGTKLILCEVHSEQVLRELSEARVIFAIGKANVTETFQEAIGRSRALLE
jgi:sulfate permease, SulP family